MSRLLDNLKIRAICDNLNIDSRTARLYVHIHNLTRGGKQTDLFENPDRSSIERILAQFTAERFPTISEQREDIQKMFLDEDYRKAMLEGYMKTIPGRIDKYALKDVFNAMIRN